MRVAIHNGDGAVTRFPNLALMKISAWHKARGNSVEWFSALDELNAFDGISEDTLAVFRQLDGNGNDNAPQEQDLFTDTGGL